jgi:hypothetical protein
MLTRKHYRLEFASQSLSLLGHALQVSTFIGKNGILASVSRLGQWR